MEVMGLRGGGGLLRDGGLLGSSSVRLGLKEMAVVGAGDNVRGCHARECQMAKMAVVRQSVWQGRE